MQQQQQQQEGAMAAAAAVSAAPAVAAAAVYHHLRAAAPGPRLVCSCPGTVREPEGCVRAILCVAMPYTPRADRLLVLLLHACL